MTAALRTMRTAPPPHYILPSEAEVSGAAKSVGLKRFSHTLAADLINLAAGGKVNPPSAWRDRIEGEAAETLPSPDSAGKWYVGGRWTSSRAEAIELAAKAKREYTQKVCDFLGTLEFEKAPGESPLERAMSVLALLSKQEGGTTGDGGEPLPVFLEKDGSPEKAAQQVNQLFDLVESLDEDEKEFIDPDGKMSALEVAQDLQSGARLILEVSRQLDAITKLQVRKQRRVEADPVGEEVRNRPIRGLHELPRVRPAAWATREMSPVYFKYQAITGQLPIRERVTRIERKQAIFILVDGSGSMNGDRHLKATGVVMNRLQAALKGDAVVYVSVFDTKMSKVEVADSPEKAREVMRRFREGNFRGGGTDIAGAVKAAHSRMEEDTRKGALLYKPEIVVLTDDDSSAGGVKAKDVPGTKVHGFAIQAKNAALKALAQSTGGVYVDSL